jgi:hypothetical protein
MTILDPKGTSVKDDTIMTKISDGVDQSDYYQIYEGSWSYPVSAVVGNYTVTVRVVDNNGKYRQSLSGFYTPFIEEESFVFNIGIVEYYDPKFLITDDLDEPLPEAQFYLTWANGTKEAYPQYTSINGFFNLTNIALGDYGFTILWKDQIVKETFVHVNSSNIYTIKTNVFKLTVKVLDSNRIPVYGSYVITETESGVGYGLDISDRSGEASFRLPAGQYLIVAHYTTDYWLTMIQTTGENPVNVVKSGFEEVILSDYPPAIWTTLGFILVLSSIIIAIVTIIVLLMYFKRINLRR